jgi:ABC-type spermidine/putrescine transport system permease subunit I
MLLPPSVFLIATYGCALIVFIMHSFFVSGGMGIVSDKVTLQNFDRILDPYYGQVLIHTALISLIVVLLSALISYPLALYVARYRTQTAIACFVFVLASSTMSLVVRALGWIGILTDNGVINHLMLSTGLISQPIQFLGSDLAVVIGLVHGFAPLFVLALLPTLHSIDRNLELAAAGLGASDWVITFKIVLPLSMPGLVGAGLLIFAMSMGAYTTPALLAGGKATVFAMLVQQQVMTVLNYPMGAALALVLLLSVLAVVLVGMKVARRFIYRPMV